MTDIINATIESANLSVADHGVLTLSILLEFELGKQVFGDVVLGKDPSIYTKGYEFNLKKYLKDIANSSNYASFFICRVMQVVGVTTFRDLTNKNIRVIVDKEGLSQKILGIGHIVENKWFMPVQEIEQIQKFKKEK